jgi:hypothetical protein
MRIKTLAILLTALIFTLSACGKKSGDTSKTDTKSEQTTTQTEQKTNKEDSIKLVQKDQADKEQKIKDALADEKILNDTLGQWAIDAEVSSTYGDENGTDKTHPYTKYQLTGKPDVENYGDDARAWVSKEADKGIEWCVVKFAKPVNSTELRIRQNFGPGAIIKVELIDTDGKSHTVWEGPDKTQYKENTQSYLFVKYDKTPYKVKSVKITLATNAVPGWNEIDAVQLVGQ